MISEFHIETIDSLCKWLWCLSHEMILSSEIVSSNTVENDIFQIAFRIVPVMVFAIILQNIVSVIHIGCRIYTHFYCIVDMIIAVCNQIIQICIQWCILQPGRCFILSLLQSYLSLSLHCSSTIVVIQLTMTVLDDQDVIFQFDEMKNDDDEVDCVMIKLMIIVNRHHAYWSKTMQLVGLISKNNWNCQKICIIIGKSNGKTGLGMSLLVSSDSVDSSDNSADDNDTVTHYNRDEATKRKVQSG
jgi:hypothetical protein